MTATHAVAGGRRPRSPRYNRRAAPPMRRTPRCSARGSGAQQWRPWARNLLVYGPFAAAVLVVQIVLYLVAPSGSSRRTRFSAGSACRCSRSDWAG
jgi:hypothetical protein